MLTVGGVVSGGGPLDTVTVTESEVHRTPSRSRATALRVWEPVPVLVVSQETAYGDELSSAPRLAPTSWTWTPTTALKPPIGPLPVTELVPEPVDTDAGA